MPMMAYLPASDRADRRRDVRRALTFIATSAVRRCRAASIDASTAGHRPPPAIPDQRAEMASGRTVASSERGAAARPGAEDI